MRRKERRERKLKTFTKRAVKVILFMALLDLQLSYLLAFLGREQIAENLSSDITKVIIGTILGYLAKSFFETREEEKVRLEEKDSCFAATATAAEPLYTWPPEAAVQRDLVPPHEWRNGE